MGHSSSKLMGHGVHLDNHGSPYAQHEVRSEMVMTSITFAAGPFLQFELNNQHIYIGFLIFNKSFAGNDYSTMSDCI